MSNHCCQEYQEDPHRISHLGTSRRNSRLLKASLALFVTMLTTPVVHANSVVISSPFSGEAGDGLSRAFYLSNYAGTNLGTVTLGYASFSPGTYVTSLVARLGAYDGTILGTVNATSVLGTTESLVTYDFGGVSVASGSTITFKQSIVSGPGSVFFDTGTTATPGITETSGTTAPLDTFRRAQIGIIVTQADSVVTPEPSTLLMFGPCVAGLLAFRMRRPG